MDFSSVMPGEKSFHAASAVKLMEMGTSFGNVLTTLWFKFVKILSFTTCFRGIGGPGLDVWFGMDGCLLWMGLVVGLEGLQLLLPICWRVGLVAMCAMTSMAGLSQRIGLSRFGPVVSLLHLMSGQMAVWFGTRYLGSALEELAFFSFASGSCWFRRSWRHLELLPLDGNTGSERSWLYFSVPKPLQTVQRAELWRAIAALQAARPVHLGVDNANVVGHVGRMLAGRRLGRPYELLVDGDLLVLVHKLLDARGPGTTNISKVKGHADEGLVRGGRVRELDKIGNDVADHAADLGWRRVGAGVMDARRNFSNACRSWYPVIRDLHRFFISISRAVVNEDGRGGTAPHHMVWSAGGRPKRRRPVEAVRNYAMLPGPQRLWTGS